MFDRFDEAELLALLEGELDPQEADALRQRLAADPGALAAVERMTDDRVLLRSLEAPDLPADILVELEPMMARPMLMAPLPGELRRHRRRRRPWGVLAAAAIAVALLAGVWATVTGLFSSDEDQSAPGRAMHADGSSEAGLPRGEGRGGDVELLVSAADGDRETWPPPGTTIHHHAPMIAAVGDAPGTAVATEVAGLSQPPEAADATLLAADFALVLQADDLTGAEETLQQVVADLGPRTALVRNFSYEEAERLEQEWLLSAAPRLEAERADAAAGLAAAKEAFKCRRDLRVLADRARQQMIARRRERPGDEVPPSEQLYGPKELAPSFEKQLELSSRGAAYTITIPARQLSEVLARLAVARGQTTVLQMLGVDEGDGAAEESAAALRWLSDYPQVRRAAARLLHDHRERVILLPVVIEQPEKR